MARQRDRTTHDTGIAPELAPPEPVREHDHAVGSGPILAGHEHPPEERRPAQHREEVGAEAVADDRLGLTEAGDRVHRVRRPSDRLEHVRAGAEPLPDGGRHGSVHAVRCPVPHADEPVGLAERERPEQRLAHDGEHGRGGPDADRQRRHHHERVPGRAQDRSRGVPQVAHDVARWSHERDSISRAMPAGPARPSAFTARGSRRPPGAAGPSGCSPVGSRVPTAGQQAPGLALRAPGRPLEPERPIDYRCQPSRYSRRT